ncbi:hypothetical protein [Leptospira yasudae]|uniref:Uncharacterized protein n=1 Tax=Leptospira yasudae TaxID=2202201 RepID=A0A6N4R0U8_9LEPT|nr:hypothetical protein [Leptospira yasudae]TGL80152.1 hypothetical protein EHQ83_16715 [Leptospira yasudae]TGL80928.1 hypothetical protein EHQ77_07160 [Leptospira yasudae]TGL81047.1 hypothetical protein EHQ72_06105 [Leptospira yasudae]
MRPKFAIKTVEMDEEVGFTGNLVLIPVENLTSAALVKAVDAWTEILKNAENLVLSNPIFEESDPWFGFGVSVQGRVLSERDLFSEIESLDPVLETSLVRYMDALIRYNQEETNGEGLPTHEELETGTFTILRLLQKNLSYLPLYLRYLGSLDLEHTVAQLDVLFSLAKQYSSSQLAPLKKFAKDFNVETLQHWLENDRAWEN